MKKIIILFSILFAFSCDDGGLDIASFDFEETIHYNTCDKYILYRYSEESHKEILMVTLTDAQIKQDTLPVSPVSVTKTGAYTVTNRIFNDDVTNSYFCAVIPPTEPKVIKDWTAEAGTILVVNTPIYDTDTINIVAFEHTISLTDVVLKSGTESIILEDVYEYGSFETTVED